MRRVDSPDSLSTRTPSRRRWAMATGALLTAIVLPATLLVAAAHAQEVYWKSPDTAGAGQRASLDLVFEDTEPAGAVEVPAIDGLHVLGAPSQATSLSFVNGQRSASYTLSYPVRLDRQGDIDIPTFEVQTRAGTQTVAGVTLRVGQAPIHGAGKQHAAAVSDVVHTQLIPSNRQPYAGEVFDVDFIVSANGGHRAQLAGTPTWEAHGIVAEPWSEGQKVAAGNGTAIRFRSHVVAPTPGTTEIGPAQQEVQISTGRRGMGDMFASNFFSDKMDDALFDSFFGREATQSVTVESQAAPIEVRALPQPAPAGFSGAVGTFHLDSKVVPSAPKTGEPVTWTLTLRGSGNWPGGVELPARAVPSEFRTLQPKQQKEFAANNLFEGSVSEDLVMIPSKPGEYHMEPVRFVYFDPQAGRYETVVAEPPVLAVTGAAANTAGPSVTTSVPQGQPAAAPHAATVAQAAKAAADVPTLPRDPISGSAYGRAPLPLPLLLALLAFPFTILTAYWLVLAARRARLTDPRRSRREALTQLSIAIERVRRASSAPQRRQALLLWQKAVSVILDLDRAAPTVAHVRETTGGADAWSELWSEADRALYAESGELAAGWCDHAATVGAQTKRPRFNPLCVFLPRNLVPATAAAALVLLCAGVSHGAETAVTSYTQGQFAAAKEQFQAAVTAQPQDWIARYNLGLAEMQTAAPARALGHTTAAFLLEPRNAAVRWNLAAFADRVAGTDPSLRQLATAEGWARVARAAAPATWQVVVFAGIVLCCASATVLLQRWYAPSDAAPRRWPARVGAIAGLTIAALAATALSQYGRLADPSAALLSDAGVLRSVPTAAQETQEQHAVPPGTVIVTRGEFLGWVKVELANGETGWVRGDTVVPFYGVPQV